MATPAQELAPNQDNSRKDRILFESLVDNEKTYLRNVLDTQLFKGPNSYEYPCAVFFRWLIKQFETIKVPAAPSTLLYNLEFLDKKTHMKELFEKDGSEAKKEMYLNNIAKSKEQQYTEDDIDPLALASASKEYIKNNVKFFDTQSVEKMNELYQNGANRDDRGFFMERLPFIMMNRSVFKLIKGLVVKLDSNQDETNMPLTKSIKIWADVVMPKKLDEEKRSDALRDLLNT